jgi:hypothetical protein
MSIYVKRRRMDELIQLQTTVNLRTSEDTIIVNRCTIRHETSAVIMPRKG